MQFSSAECVHAVAQQTSRSCSSCKTETLCPSNNCSHSPSPPPLVTTILLPVSVSLTALDNRFSREFELEFQCEHVKITFYIINTICKKKLMYYLYKSQRNKMWNDSLKLGFLESTNILNNAHLINNMVLFKKCYIRLRAVSTYRRSD